MRAMISTRDYEALSAYIDGQLSPGELRKLEERLHARPDLQTALDEMRRTRALLRQAPRRKAPRNFTLTPAMVGEQKRRAAPSFNWFPALSFASAMAALALIVIVVMQLAPGAQPPITVAMQPGMEEAAPAMKTMSEAPAGTQSAAAAQAAPENPPAPENAQPQSTQAALSAPAADLSAPNATPEPDAVIMAQPAMEGTPTGELSQSAAAAESTIPPIINWSNSGTMAGSAGLATGLGGGMGGGGGAGGAGGPPVGGLLGPPVPPVGALGKGGGLPEGQAQDGNLLLPPEAAVTLTPEPAQAAETPAAPDATAIAELPAAQESASGTGPILGVPQVEQGGQIVDKRALLGQPGAASAANPPAGDRSGLEEQPAQPPASEPQPQAAVQPARVLGLDPLPLLALEVILGGLALASGVAAYLFWRRRRGLSK